MFVYMFLNLCVCAYLCEFVHVCVYVFVYVYVCVYMYLRVSEIVKITFGIIQLGVMQLI